MNPQDCVWKNLYRITMRTILQEKGTIHCNITIWYTNLFPCFKAMNISAAKAAVDKEWEKLEKNPAWDLTKVRSKKEVIDEARTMGAKVHFASLMDICHLKNAELEAKHQKNKKGRVVLRGDIVKDDSGSMQYSQNKDHQHHKRQQQKSLILYPDCQDAQDKQLVQYLHKPR